jgi:hypothetical protein
MLFGWLHVTLAARTTELGQEIRAKRETAYSLELDVSELTQLQAKAKAPEVLESRRLELGFVPQEATYLLAPDLEGWDHTDPDQTDLLGAASGLDTGTD